LWIVKQLVLLQDGTVGAEFPAQGGSIFWIELPASRAESETRPVLITAEA
jgi:hypothetical protein